MKKMIYLLAVAGMVVFAGCSKEHRCKCEKTDVEAGALDENMVFTLEGSVGCDNITEMAFEEHVSVEGGMSLRRVDVHKVKCRDYGD
ncbi:MAG: hypothetical protein IJR04_03030 [Bacteroidales bacterium]|nr:hypothetical protein [Bacteroidales bacterium]